MNTQLSLIKFYKFKALSEHSINLKAMNILVGPNNCGKSTIISAFRMLEVAMRIGNSKTPIKVPHGDDCSMLGHAIHEDQLPVSLENVHTNYADEDSRIEFHFTSKEKLILFFPSNGGCFLNWGKENQHIRSISDFRKTFPIKVQVVPVLGPFEHEEPILTDDTVKKGLGTHRASRHFRNYWLRNIDSFEDFKKMISLTWPGMNLKAPEVQGKHIFMFYSEKRIDREIFWSGFGFQIWCQLLTHIFRANEYDICVIDEPEIYLHPDIQRQLLGILRDIKSDVVIATHSTEIIGEAEPSEILLIDKEKKSAFRLKEVGGIQAALNALGSLQNITLAQLARTKKILFVEGLYDFKIIRRFAKKLNYNDIANANGFTPLESGGFSSWENVRSFAWGMNKLNAGIEIAAVYDSDYWCEEELLSIYNDLEKHLKFAHILSRKEIENYLLSPQVLNRLLKKLISGTDKKTKMTEPNSEEILKEITSKKMVEIQSQYIAKYCQFFKPSGKDSSTLTKEALTSFSKKWDNIYDRLKISPGKSTLSEYRAYVLATWGVNLSDTKIIEEFKADEIDDNLKKLIEKLDAYRKNKIKA